MEVPDGDADNYIRAGFRPDPCRFRWMRRPTVVFEGEHPEMIWRRAETACDSGETRLMLEREAGLFLLKHAQGGESYGERGAVFFSGDAASGFGNLPPKARKPCWKPGRSV
ncbi:hypothetical protein VQ056_30040 [Paenibacillus sp. JTLBN-2024]